MYPFSISDLGGSRKKIHGWQGQVAYSGRGRFRILASLSDSKMEFMAFGPRGLDRTAHLSQTLPAPSNPTPAHHLLYFPLQPFLCSRRPSWKATHIPWHKQIPRPWNACLWPPSHFICPSNLFLQESSQVLFLSRIFSDSSGKEGLLLSRLLPRSLSLWGTLIPSYFQLCFLNWGHACLLSLHHPLPLAVKSHRPGSESQLPWGLKAVSFWVSLEPLGHNFLFPALPRDLL